MPPLPRPCLRPSLWRALLALLLLQLWACAAPPRPAPEAEELALPPAQAALWRELQALRTDGWFHLLNTGQEGLSWRLRAIDSATRSIDIQTFIWKDDRTGSLILQRVLAAADRGVKVRILIDDSFLAGFDRTISQLVRHPGLEYRIYNPVVHRGGGALTRELANVGDFSRIDHRMHNKLLVVDGRVAIVGGRNMADEYFGYHERHNFRDVEVLLGGPAVQSLSAAFDRYWNNRWSVPAQRIVGPDGDDADLVDGAGALSWPQESAAERTRQWNEVVSQASPGQARLLVDQPPEDPAIDMLRSSRLTLDLITSLAETRDEVLLVSAYFVPTPQLQGAIAKLEQRGVDVTVLTNSLASNNHASAHSAYRQHREALLNSGARLLELRADALDRQRYLEVPEAESILGLHAKVLVLDAQRVFIGSANLDPRSLRLNTEIGLLIESPELNARLRQLLTLDQSPRNAWQVELTDAGGLRWISDGASLRSEPEASFFLRAESWLFGLLPIEGEM